MELKKLNTRVLKMWYFIPAVISVLIVASFVLAAVILNLENASDSVRLAVLLSLGIVESLIVALILIYPYFRYKMYSWGYDDKTIEVREGVIFRHRVLIPVCQIQDLHRFEGPIKMLFKVSGVTISTAGSNFDISTLTTSEADALISDLEAKLEARIEEHRNEEI